MRNNSLCRRAGSLDGSDILLLDFILTLKTLLLAADADLWVGAFDCHALYLATSASLAGLFETSRVVSRLGGVDDGDSVDTVHSLVGLSSDRASDVGRTVGGG
jgi:hypothetical protein